MSAKMTVSRILALLSVTLPAFQQDRCAEFGLKRAGGVNGYDWRDNRCEGEYIRDVASSADLQLVSFGAPVPASALTGASPISLAWATAGAALRIRGESLRSRHYYRMDAKPGAVNSFQGPTRVLSQFKLQDRELGIVAWTGAGSAVRYVPIEVNGSKTVAILVRPAAELSEVYMTLRAEPSGTVVARDKALGLNVYPAGRGFQVALPKLPRPGLYRLSLAATLRDGGSANGVYVLQLPAN